MVSNSFCVGVLLCFYCCACYGKRSFDLFSSLLCCFLGSLSLYFFIQPLASSNSQIIYIIADKIIYSKQSLNKRVQFENPNLNSRYNQKISTAQRRIITQNPIQMHYRYFELIKCVNFKSNYIYCYISNFINIQYLIKLKNHKIVQLFGYKTKINILIQYVNIQIYTQMMKKYFLKGKEYLSQKLQQLDIKTGSIDYVAEQIPNRLKEPLSVLQREQIDLEDSHAYQTYFKSYPNHHLSHFLLDKYNMMIEAEAEPKKYSLPANSQFHIPTFNQDLQRKALLFREAIQQYDEGYAKNQEPIVCICVINFHHKRGTEIQYRFPQSKAVQSLETMIIHHAMPDSSHNKAQDYNFFNFEADYKNKKRMLFGVSYFKQIKLTQNMKKQNSQFTRSYLQKAAAILSTVPLFGYLKVKLCITTKVFFEKFTNFQIIDAAYKQLNKQISDSWPNMQINDLYIGSDLKVIMSLFTVPDFYEIWKAVLYQKRIVVFAHSSSSASSFILSLMSLFPGLSTFGIYSKPIAKYMQSLRQLALPLRLFNSQNFLSISFHIQDFWQLSKFKKSQKGNFLLGTTNRLLKQNNDYGIELLVNLENCTIQKFKSRRPWESLSKKQKNFIHELEAMVNQQKNLGYEGSQDCIRNHFHNFLKGALVQIIQGMKAFRKFTIDCKQYMDHIEKQKQIQKQNSQNKQSIVKQLNNQSNDFPPLFPQETNKMIFSELLLQKSFAYFMQFKNDNLPQIVTGKIIPSLFISNYDYLLRLTETQFITYNWVDKKLSFGKGTVNNFQGKQIKFKSNQNQQENDQTKSIYVGHIENGKFSKNGCFVDEFCHYEGQYKQGVKEGYGKFVNQNEKYLGYFHNNLYQGQGQLVVGSDIYVGEFKEGQKHGYGSIQGKDNFQGIWEHDKPIKQVKKIENQTKEEQKEVQQSLVQTNKIQQENNESKKNQVEKQKDKNQVKDQVTKSQPKVAQYSRVQQQQKANNKQNVDQDNSPQKNQAESKVQEQKNEGQTQTSIKKQGEGQQKSEANKTQNGQQQNQQIPKNQQK